MDEGNNDNVFKFGAVKGGKDDHEQDDRLPQHDYIIVDIDNNEFDANGFLIFTTHHLAIMQDVGNGKGAIPVIVFPFSRVKFAGLADLINEEV